MKTAVEWLKEQYDYCPKYEERIHDEDWDQAKEMEKQQQGYSEEDLFKILLDFVAFPHDHMEPRGSIIERYLNELSQKNETN
jgi:hypothetical protein